MQRNEYGMYEHDFVHYRGDSFEEVIKIQGVDVQNLTFSMHIAPSGQDILQPIIEKLSDGVRLVLTPDMTQNLTWSNAKYDLQTTDSSGAVKTILKGNFKLLKDVTS